MPDAPLSQTEGARTFDALRLAIGRTLRLVLLNCLDCRPGVLDKSTQGWPGKYSLCFAEDEGASPWEPLSV